MTWIRIHFFQCGSKIRIRIYLMDPKHWFILEQHFRLFAISCIFYISKIKIRYMSREEKSLDIQIHFMLGMLVIKCIFFIGYLFLVFMSSFLYHFLF